MHRILDFNHEEAIEVASRVANALHRAIDDHFPAIENASQRFSKTAFSGEDTLLNQKSIPEAKTESPAPSKSAAKPQSQPPMSHSPMPDISQHGPGEFTHIETINRAAKPGNLMRRILMLILITALLSAGVAYFVFQFLVI